jgi:hypothetical protein
MKEDCPPHGEEGLKNTLESIFFRVLPHGIFIMIKKQ